MMNRLPYLGQEDTGPVQPLYDEKHAISMITVSVDQLQLNERYAARTAQGELQYFCSYTGLQSASGLSNYQMNQPANVNLIPSMNGYYWNQITTQATFGQEISPVRPQVSFVRDNFLPTGVQSASGFSNDQMNHPGNCQILLQKTIGQENEVCSPPFQTYQPVIGHLIGPGEAVQLVSGFNNGQMKYFGNSQLQMIQNPETGNGNQIPFQWTGNQLTDGPQFPIQAVSSLETDTQHLHQDRSIMYQSSVKGNHKTLPLDHSRCHKATDGSIGSKRNETIDFTVDQVPSGNNSLILQQRLMSSINNYSEKRFRCIQSYTKKGFDRDSAEAYGTELRYNTDGMGNKVRCLQCHAIADNTDEFHHLDSCLVYKLMKETGYTLSDEESLLQNTDSDESMEPLKCGINSLSREDANMSDFQTATELKTLKDGDSLFASSNNSKALSQNHEERQTTIKQLKRMGYTEKTIRDIHQLYGPDCLKSSDHFLSCEKRSQSSDKRNTCLAKNASSVLLNGNLGSRPNSGGKPMLNDVQCFGIAPYSGNTQNCGGNPNSGVAQNHGVASNYGGTPTYGSAPNYAGAQNYGGTSNNARAQNYGGTPNNSGVPGYSITQNYGVAWNTDVRLMSTALMHDDPVSGALRSDPTWRDSEYATAHTRVPNSVHFNNGPKSMVNRRDVLLPQTRNRGSMIHASDYDVRRDSQVCLGCNQGRPCVTQTPCRHVVCETCGHYSIQFCVVCKEFVRGRGLYDASIK